MTVRSTRRLAASSAPASPKPRAAGALDGFLRAASRLRRGAGPEGREGLLTPNERARLQSLSPAHHGELARLLDGLNGPSAELARALVLKAAAARAEVLSPRTLGTVRSFAERLRQLPAAELSTRATVLDLDSRRNDSRFDPMTLWDRRGVIHGRARVDGAADNDGLFQRFTGSCGAAVIQMMAAEADPVLAFELHDGGLRSDSTSDAAAAFQRELLSTFGSAALGRTEAQARARLRNALGRLHRAGEVSAQGRDALLAHALRQGPLTAPALRALERLRETYGGFPDDALLERLRRHVQPEQDDGIGVEDFTRALERHVTPLTGIRYAQTHPPEGFSRGQAYRHLDRVEEALRRGADVPFGLVEPAHWMLLTAVRGKEPARAFLVSDPDGGRTAWVTERDLVRGTFADRQFHLSRDDERPYIDCFFLPTS